MSWAPKIAFGTSGWRAILADEFTFDNVRIVVRAIAEELLAEENHLGGVVVSHDTRFLGARFAELAARVLAGAGIKPHLTDRDAPTPVISFEIIRRQAAGGINFTASHNPAEYQGLKFSPHHGGPASKKLTQSLEHRIAGLQSSEAGIEMGELAPDRIDPAPAYRKRLAELVRLDLIRKSGGRILCNHLYGTSRDYLDHVLRSAGCQIDAMNDRPEPGFGGFPPEPAPEYVGDFLKRLGGGEYRLGLATDGDADRFGVFEPESAGEAAFAPNANEILALLLDYLVESRGWKGKVVRSVATSHFVDRVAALHGCEVIEVPVGFKWIAEQMEADPKGFVIGGEESGGLTIRGHVPEKDGILACLLAAEMVAARGKSLRAQLAELQSKTERIVSRRINLHYAPQDREHLLRAAATNPGSVAGRKVARSVEIDGYKYILDDGSWLMLRFSGTEPVIRLYLEGAPSRIDELERAGRAWIEQR